MTHLRKGEKIAFLVLICTLFWYCREKPAAEKEILKETIVEITNPKVIVDLCASAGVSITDTTDIDPFLRFKMIDNSGVIQDINIDEAARLFKRSKSGKKVSEIPLMEFKEADKTLMMFNSRGYGGPIWVTLILNNNNSQFENVQFEHLAESEGYAAGFTMSSFEDQFTGVEIKAGDTNFGIEQGDKLVLKGSYTVDGISGATQTSMAGIEMMNMGISRVKNYAFPKKVK